MFFVRYPFIVLVRTESTEFDDEVGQTDITNNVNKHCSLFGFF